MKRIVMTLAVLLVMAGLAMAQKIDQRLTRLVEQSNNRRAQGMAPLDAKSVNKTIAVSFNADGTIAAFSGIAMLKQGAACPTERLEQMGVKVRFQIGDMVVLTIPADKLLQLEDVEEFRYVKADEMMQPMNDLARKETKADQITDATKATAAGLPQAYTGSGVVLGVIDTGIDFNHAAFRRADGTTRIKKAIIMTSNDGGYKYYESDEIPSLTSDNMNSSHGTHTTATAGGSETGNGQQGVAPEADLFLCGLGNNTSNANIAWCIKEIFNYAEEVNKPAVVSISMGNIIGLHDGSNTMSLMVEDLTGMGSKPGRAVLMSSSNAAANCQTIVKSGNIKTVLGSSSIVSATAPATYTGLYCFYAADYQDFNIELKLVDTKTGAVSDLGDHVLDMNTGIALTDFKLNKYAKTATVNPDKTAVVYYLDCQAGAVKLDDQKYRLAIVATSNDGQTLKMISNGDSYAEFCLDAPAEDGGYNFSANGWTRGTGDISINTGICSDVIISVGSYNTRVAWETWQGKSRYYLNSQVTGKKPQIGEISDFSGWGTDDNNKHYPTVIAPGQGIISAANSYDYQTFVYDESNPGGAEPNMQGSTAPNYLIGNVDKNGRRNWYVLEQGTSMSTPHAAGIVALWMQAKPALTINEIKQIMKETSVNDDWTTNAYNIPSGKKIQAGCGKIAALAGLKKIKNSTAIEAVSVDGHREATPATMYSVDAPVYNMMGQQVDKSQRGLVIYKGRKYVNK